jgi:hypothetical protein
MTDECEGCKAAQAGYLTLKRMGLGEKVAVICKKHVKAFGENLEAVG